ncbi:hypothetical protein P22_2789 [Propionispora sp. 2/2-37]|uniref:BglG family transcription antiterminator n=1 Tax=Propionispora sp. 2/2-37 TaxID=1677858 RepID=UPI0006BB6670|nr:transcription antiterminator [Propionispora sp. 2/2-37]CUH96699.1 hypothetical protein P22_2789 [Propionispora sp. 2/2-37]
MEGLTKREKEILLILAKATEYVSADSIAGQLNVSKKTIYRNLHSLEQKLSEKNVLSKQPGKGYKVRQVEFIHTFADTLPEHGLLDMSLAERRQHLLTFLLLQAPKNTSINQLSDLYYLSSASIVNDLNIIEGALREYQLALIRSRQGTHVEGTEENIRKMLMKLLSDSLEHGDYLTAESVSDDLHQKTYAGLYKGFSSKDIYFVKQILSEGEVILKGNIKEPYYINIFTHVLILIKRLTNRTHYETTKPPKGSFKNQTAYLAARRMMEHIAGYVNKKVPEIEIFYIYRYLISSGIENGAPREIVITESPEKEFVWWLIAHVSKKVYVDFTQDLNLQQSLFLHIQPLTKRLAYDISIANPLLEDIKKEFPAIFGAVRQSVHEQEIMPNFQSLTDDEIGYITVYFQASLENQMQRQRVLIVCSSGAGTSHLLGARVKRAFSDWEIVDIVSANRLAAIRDMDAIDFILTTVHLEPQEVPCILVSALFSELDILKVKNVLLNEHKPKLQNVLSI